MENATTGYAPPALSPATGQQQRRLWKIGRLARANDAIEAVTTRCHIAASPEEVWHRLMFFEEVPQRARGLLRTVLPQPIRTAGEGKRIGAVVQCLYTSGCLMKRITAIEPPHTLRFEVVAQELGIESCVTTVAGAYEIRGDADGATVALTTRYRGHLRPRLLWRPFERVVAHQLHRHILSGMSVPGTCSGSASADSRSGRLD